MFVITYWNLNISMDWWSRNYKFLLKLWIIVMMNYELCYMNYGLCYMNYGLCYELWIIVMMNYELCYINYGSWILFVFIKFVNTILMMTVLNNVSNWKGRKFYIWIKKKNKIYKIDYYCIFDLVWLQKQNFSQVTLHK